jgi:hypothetical protein
MSMRLINRIVAFSRVINASLQFLARGGVDNRHGKKQNSEKDHQKIKHGNPFLAYQGPRF